MSKSSLALASFWRRKSRLAVHSCSSSSPWAKSQLTPSEQPPSDLSRKIGAVRFALPSSKISRFCSQTSEFSLQAAQQSGLHSRENEIPLGKIDLKHNKFLQNTNFCAMFQKKVLSRSLSRPTSLTQNFFYWCQDISLRLSPTLGLDLYCAWPTASCKKWKLQFVV